VEIWYITVLVVTTLIPSQAWMQYTQGFKDETSCIAYLEEPGIKKMVEKDINHQMANVITDMGEYFCATQRDVINRNTLLGHGAKSI
jgi:hypothetical protein